MKQLDLTSYRRVNETFRRRMVCRIGVDCGFFVEMNYMIDAMLYCLKHQIRFQLYSDDANFGTGTGWREYFLPFCEEVHEPFHRKFNFHRPPSWRRIINGCRKQKSIRPFVWKIKSILKTMIGRLVSFWVYKEYVLLGQDATLLPDSHYCIPALDMDCSYAEAYGLLARMVFRFCPDIVRHEAVDRERLVLPPIYEAVHIRGGDKRTETELISGEHIMQVLHPENDACVFVLTDDYRLFQRLQKDYPKLRLVTLCQTDELGYHHRDFCQLSPDKRKEAIIRLLVSVQLLLGSRSFVGSITTGPSVFVMKLRADDSFVLAVDCPQECLTSSLSQPIDVRTTLSKKYLHSL